MPLESWGRYPKARQAAVTVHWRSDPLPRVHGTLLPFGQGRSYGDCCLTDGATLLETSRLDRFIEFDPGPGILRCEAGQRVGDILAFTVARGFLAAFRVHRRLDRAAPTRAARPVLPRRPFDPRGQDEAAAAGRRVPLGPAGLCRERPDRGCLRRAVLRARPLARRPPVVASCAILLSARRPRP